MSEKDAELSEKEAEFTKIKSEYEKIKLPPVIPTTAKRRKQASTSVEEDANVSRGFLKLVLGKFSNCRVDFGFRK